MDIAGHHPSTSKLRKGAWNFFFGLGLAIDGCLRPNKIPTSPTMHAYHVISKSWSPESLQAANIIGLVLHVTQCLFVSEKILHPEAILPFVREMSVEAHHEQSTTHFWFLHMWANLLFSAVLQFSRQQRPGKGNPVCWKKNFEGGELALRGLPTTGLVDQESSLLWVDKVRATAAKLGWQPLWRSTETLGGKLVVHGGFTTGGVVQFLVHEGTTTGGVQFVVHRGTGTMGGQLVVTGGTGTVNVTEDGDV
ncbi:hypothetical protein EDD18DRAFT_1426523 [Armillaria luteobubalina]|uniref:Uncharacterized protein n=1 Tax=Armillaria luteobubalina TaxID=153913 RepID=A0AA39QH84_9AGAR|nr:hypothetical protein EDD18DRAFT_1426523 [Armillaria luteobubalina]